ncbi:MAG: GDSL-type esterase/lipase family protein [Terracidiphilus sp.]|nr:GDSL-type esterase/lipase family protein [Terracidiphilus sp.]
MSRRLPIRIQAVALAALLVSLTSGPLLAGHPAKRKHHGPESSAPTAKAHLGAAGRAAAGKAAQARAHARVHYLAGPRIDPIRKAELVEEIGARLKEPAAQPIAYHSALDGFYSQLESHEAALTDSGPLTTTVRVMQFGDSHTAADMFTGEARRVFQQQFGDGGIGYSYAGHPFAGYRILGSQRSQSSGWKTQGNKFLQLGDGQTGLGGISISTARAGEWVTLDAPCATLELQYLQQPGGGSLRFSDNGEEPVEIQTDSAVTGPGTFSYYCPPGDHHFEVTTGQSAPVTLLGWVATQPGVTWESIGINGAEAPLMLKWNQPLFSRYLKDNSPALIVLAYGTNEAASPLWDEESYRQAFASLIDTIHSYVPESSILVVGPPDRSVAQHRSWHPYAGTDRIVDAQRAVCRTHGCAYWDQRARMGGLGAMQQFVYAGWAQPDHTHFTGGGYRALADALVGDLMTGYQAFKQHNPDKIETAQGVHDGASGSNP